MTGKDQFDDEFEAFLHGRDDLSRHLRTLAQPEPPAELDAVILARAEADLAHSAANDPVMPDEAGRAQPGFLRRWRAPLAMAASVVCAFLLLLRWQTHSEAPAPLVVAQVSPPPAVEAPPTRQPAAMPPAQSAARGALGEKPPAAKPQPAVQRQAGTSVADPQVAPKPDAGRDTAMAPVQIAQADTLETIPRAGIMAAPARAPTPAAVPGHSPAADTTAIAAPPSPSSDPEKAKAWVALIEELLKADLRQDALTEWDKFRKAYPQYPVPGKLEAHIEALQKQPR
ncbi:hypothetical protein [Noviherbaspirillum autotrophicum]|uniref:Uncharacterized protein n=1 Tax=Noviherbaspirillum autotrophicum TaxID=709839 RepID=A0A0C2BUH0_9BURK|nr:hypothetical protein [Noviherbaspirillum autotrophicum]KIF81686.1 hypothetical protein TSA66_14250 [Noviherbaspirillum autotrophicum]KIF82053.1 hypothetical protein TSA66_16615 [Noviherbaspirillum autotrophicum]KIF84153.1 hypothetical protein TSA66_00405 [Noviherbaspirillum autotrophicum]